MESYKHYIRVDVNNNIIDRYSEWENKFQVGDVLVETNDQRHYNFPITNVRGQLIYKVVSGAMTARTQAELDSEWASRPIPPDPDTELANAINAATDISTLKAALLGINGGRLAKVSGKLK